MVNLFRYFWVVLLLAIITGCASVKTVTEYVEVSPVAPPRIERPVLDTASLKRGDNAGTVIQAHRIDIKRLQKWGLEQEAILDGYRTKKDSK